MAANHLPKTTPCYDAWFQDFNRVGDSWSTSVQEYISLADQLEQSVLFNLRMEGDQGSKSIDF